MGNNNRGRSDTNFRNLTFDEIKESLIEKAKIYYPDAYKDFNTTSFGGMMLDLISMVGEQLNFYAQFIANENFAETSRTTYALQQHAQTAGTQVSNRYTSTSNMSFYVYVPISNIDSSIDKSYACRLLAGAKAINELGHVYTLLHDVPIDFNSRNFIGTHFSTDGSKETYASFELVGKAISGEEKEISIDIGSAEKFLKVEIKDDSVTDILSVKDSGGNEYYQVDNLSQNIVYRSISDRNNVDPLRPELMMPLPVPRRFVVERSGDRTYLIFGHGSQRSLQTKPSISGVDLDRTKNFMQLDRQPLSIAGKSTVLTGLVFDPSRLLQTDGFGVSPQNTTLTVRYRSNTTENSNSSIGTVNQVISAELVFDDTTNLEQSKMDYMRSVANISCTNKEPFNGSLTYTTKREMVETINAAKGSQGRAVTAKDYAAAAYLMPSKWGSVKRASLVKDDNDFRRNLNLYVVSEDSSGKLQKASKALKQNVKTHLNAVRMISDSIDVFDAKIINLGLEFDIVASDRVNKTSIMSEIRSHLYDEITLAAPQVGQHFSIGEIERILNSMKQILRVNSVKVKNKIGINHSDTRHDVSSNISPDGGMVYIPKDCIWEIKYIEDIVGKVQ